MWRPASTLATLLVVLPALTLPALTLPALTLPVLAQAPNEASRQQLHNAERQLERERAQQAEVEARARAATEAARQAEADRLAAIAALRLADAAANASAGRVAEAVAAQARADRALAEQSARLAPFLPVLTRLALHPEATMLVQPVPPAETLAALALLRSHSRSLGAQAQAMDAAARAAGSARAALDAEHATLTETVARARQAAAALDSVLAASRVARTEAEREEDAQARRVAQAAARAADLRGVIQRLEQAPPNPPSPPQAAAGRPMAAPRPLTHGALGWPVAGPVVREFGAARDGIVETGITIAAAPGARVLAPWDGKVVYAGPFRSLGLLLILECGDAYHVVLAGMERLDVAVGNTVRMGDPVGTMAAHDARLHGPRPALGLELRRAGRPIDPEPWLSRGGGRQG
jgi:septal ring factor EnvC (AmiA/AmiB activator)